MDLSDLVRLSAIVFILNFGCGNRVGLTVADGSQGSGGSIGPGGVGGVGGSRVVGGSGSVGGSGGASQCTTNLCEAFGSRCTGTEVPVRCIEAIPDSISEGRNPSCEDVCGGSKCCTGIGPCTGTAVKCPSGQLCAYPDAMENTTDFVAKCMPEEQTCGGPSNKPCPDGQYCELFGILCSQPPTVHCPSTASPCDYAKKGGVGICRMNPPASQCVPGVQPTCGCDGVTYPSPCARMAANVFLASMGSCPLDGGISISDARVQ